MINKKCNALIGTLLLSLSTISSSNEVSEEMLNDYLRNFYLAEKCPSGIGMKMKNIDVKGCLRGVSYWTDLDAVIFDYILFKSSEHVGDFSKKSKSERERVLKIETTALGYSVGKLMHEELSTPIGSIQFTPVNFITKSGHDKDEIDLKRWVESNSVISLSLIYEHKWHVGFINKDGSFSYKESFDTDPHDPVITPLHFLEKTAKAKER